VFYWEENQERVEELLRYSQVAERNKGFFYEDIEDIVEYANDQCTIGCYEDEDNLIHGFIILDWVDDGVALLHVCTFTHEFDWVKAWKTQIEKEVSKIAHQLHVVVSSDMIPIIILAKRIGFKFQKIGNNYKGLKDL